MKIAKIINKKGRELFAEVVKMGRVLFDARPGWVRVSSPLDVRPRKRDVQCLHPEDVQFVWVRNFNF